LGVNVGSPIVTNGDGDALFPNYFWEDLLLKRILKLIFNTAKITVTYESMIIDNDVTLL